MPKRALSKCPICDETLAITELQCEECGTVLKGDFPPTHCAYCGLPEDQQKFLDLFLRCRGNLRDVERSLGVSYPTVRARFEVLLSSLGYAADSPLPSETPEDEESSVTAPKRQSILEDLSAGRLSPDEAVRALETLE